MTSVTGASTLPSPSDTTGRGNAPRPQRSLRSLRGIVAAAVSLAWAVTLPAAAAAGTPSVFVTVPPVHSLVAAVTDGVTEPFLLLRGGVSPHQYTLRPSEARALQDADLVIWVGPALETFFARAVEAGSDTRRVIELMRTPGITVLPARTGGDFANAGAELGTGNDRSHGHGHGHDHDHDLGDPHLWLDPDNATAIVRAVADALAAMDPGNAARYRANAAATEQRIAALDAEIARRLAPVKDAPYVVFHDAYQGFERRYGLRAVGAVTVSPGRAPGAERLRALRARIRELGARCVFAEPQFEPRLARTLVEDTGARVGVLDPLGAELAPGPQAWFETMRGLADGLTACLAPG